VMMMLATTPALKLTFGRFMGYEIANKMQQDVATNVFLCLPPRFGAASATIDQRNDSTISISSSCPKLC